MARPIFAPTDIKLLRKCIILALRNKEHELTDDEVKELEVMYHRLSRVGD